MAGNALLLNELRNQLTGVFAVTNGTQIATGSALSAFSAVGTLVPPQSANLTTPIPASSTAPAALTPPEWSSLFGDFRRGNPGDHHLGADQCPLTEA